MPFNLKEGYKDVEDKINSYKTSVDAIKTKRDLKLASLGDSFQNKKDKVTKNLNEFGTDSKNFEKDVKNQYEKLIEFFKLSFPSGDKLKEKIQDKKNSFSLDTPYDSVDFLLRQILDASKNTKERISEIFIEETIKTAGCSEEQQFSGCDNNDNNCNNKIYVSVNQIDLFKILFLNPEEGNNDLLYEKDESDNGDIPYSLNRELYKRLQNPTVSFSDEYGSGLIGSNGSPIMDIKYVTSYNQGGNTFFGDFYEITLYNRVTGNGISDFLYDYYKTIEIFNFDDFLVTLTNSFSNFLDIGLNITTNEKSKRSKFEIIIQRILGICFDNTNEIDVAGTSKLSELDHLDQSFFELTDLDLRNIENDLENFSQGMIEFVDCDNIKLPVDVNTTAENIRFIRNLPPQKKVDEFVSNINNSVNNPDYTSSIPNNLNINLSIKDDLLKIVPKSIVQSILSPKVLLGFMTVLKAVESEVVDKIEDLNSFTDNMKSFMVNLISKIGAIFIEELFELLKKNINQLVSLILREIIKESANSKIVIVTTILNILLQLASFAVDWRKCKSVVDEILNLLSLSLNTPSRIPTFALASSTVLGGYSPTRATTNIIEGLQSLGLPTGDLPSGAPNVSIAAISEQVIGSYQEQLANGKTEVFIPPLAVLALGGGSTLPGRGVGKSY